MAGLRDAFQRRLDVGDPEKLREELEKSRSADPVGYELGMANLAAAQGRAEEALEHARKAHELRPDDAKVLRAMAYCHLNFI